MSDIETAFQDGCDTIVAGCTTYGSTPTTNSPSAIVTSIKNIYTDRYNAGVTATKKGTAAAAQVLTGYTFTNSSSVGISGTMTNNGAVSKTITPSTSSQSYTIPKGYHNGSGKVTVSAVDPNLKCLISVMSSDGLYYYRAESFDSSVTVSSVNGTTISTTVTINTAGTYTLRILGGARGTVNDTTILLKYGSTTIYKGTPGELPTYKTYTFAKGTIITISAPGGSGVAFVTVGIV